MAQAQLPARTLGRAQPRSTAWQSVLAMVVMFLFTIYFLMPLVWLILSATKSNADLSSTFGLWFSAHPQLLTNLRLLVTADGGIFWRWMLNTFIYTLGAAFGGTLLAAMAGYALAKFRFGLRGPIFTAVLGAIMVPTTALVLPIFLLETKIGLVDTYWAVLLPSLVSPFGVYLMRVYAAQSIPDDLLDAARVDGAGEFRTFFAVAMRVLTPGLVTVFLFQFVGTWNNYFLPLVALHDSKLFPVTLGLWQWSSVANGSTGASADITHALVVAGALVSVLPLVIAFIFLQRYWKSGLAVGSVKG